MKKIIHFHPNGNYSKKFIEPLQKSEVKLGFVSIMVNQINPTKLAHKIKFIFTKKNFFTLPFNFILLLLLIRRIKPDIIFAHNSTAAFLPLLACKMLFIKKRIYFNHGVPFIAYKGFLRFTLYILEKINCMLSSDVITVSEAMKKTLSSVSKKNIILIANGSACGLDFDEFEIEKKTLLTTRKKNKLKSKDKIILFVGRPNYRKGFNDIIEIWEKYFKSKLDYKLILLGIKKTDVLKLSSKISNNIIPMSFVKKPHKFFLIADYLFVTSYHEGLNYSVLEAMISNTLVISNEIEGMSEVIKNNFNGFLIKNNNHKMFFEKVIHCEKNLSIKNFINKNSFNSVKKFERKLFLKDYTKVIQNL